MKVNLPYYWKTSASCLILFLIYFLNISLFFIAIWERVKPVSLQIKKSISNAPHVLLFAE